MKNILPILLLIISAALFYFYLGPRYDRIQALSLERDRYDDILRQSAELREIRRELKEKLENLSPALLDSLEKIIPSGLDVPQLILDLDSLAVKRGIVMKAITASEISQTGRRGGEMPSSQPYTILAINFSFAAPYANFISFLKDLETSLRIMDVVSVSISPGKEEPLVQGYGLTVYTYWLKDENVQ